MTKRTINEVHPIAQLFPMLEDAELAVLAENIKLNGLLVPITLDPNGILLDGRNRLKACEIAGLEPRFAIHDGDPVELILSRNIARRHLNVGQRTMIVALAYPDPGQCGRKSSFVSELETFVPPEWPVALIRGTYNHQALARSCVGSDLGLMQLPASSVGCKTNPAANPDCARLRRANDRGH
jgi:hypothetical protein